MSTTVRAKMRCVRKTQSTEQGGYGPPNPVAYESVEFQPVTGPGNESWSKWTPSGDLKLQITNRDVLQKFEVGKDYHIDISPVEDEAAQPA